MFKKTAYILGSAISALASGALIWFGYAVLKEDAEDGAHIFGARGYIFNADTRWFGLALVFALVTSFLISKSTRVSFGKVLGLAVAIISSVFILLPELA
jgi:hypothetical protein